MDEGGDCSTDGTCEDSGGSEGFGDPKPGDKFSGLTLMEETSLAVQQFSIVIGVALLVCALFFLMMVVDKVTGFIAGQWMKRCGGEDAKVKDPEDPAALVGSFKRYK